MKQCWPEGDLRAYLDGELPLQTQERIGEHLEQCGECGALCEQLAARASRVSSLLAILPEPGPIAMPAAKMMLVRSGRRRSWMVPALTLAAALAIGFIVLPRHGAMTTPVAKAPAMVPPAPVETTVATQAATVSPVTPPAKLVHQATSRRPAPQADFLRLDDEPLETATLVRVSAENGAVQADLLVGPDGRAHAIRVISNQ